MPQISGLTGPWGVIARDSLENSHLIPKKIPTHIFHGKLCLKVITFKVNFTVYICRVLFFT